MAYPKSHGLQIAPNSHIKNMTVETFADDTAEPTPTESGRMWYNTARNCYRGVVSDGVGGLTIVSLIGSESGNAGINIEDEGTQIATGVETLNFIGGDIRAMDGGGTKINIYSPPPQYPNPFNDGSSADTGFSSNSVPTWTTDVSNRTIATPTSEGTPFYTNGWAGGVHPRIPSSRTSFSYSTPGTANTLFATNTSSITAEVLGGSGTATQLAACTLSDISGNGSNTQNGISINVSGWSAQFDKYKGDISVNFDISGLMAGGQPLENGGRFQLKITHSDGGSDYTFSQDFFMDTGTASDFNDSTGDVSIAVNTAQTKNISGVTYYANGTTWDVTVAGVDNLNSNTYTNPLLSLTMSDYGLGSDNVDRSDSTWTGLTTAWDNTGAQYAHTYTMSNSTFRKLGSAQISAVTKGNTTSGETKNSSAQNVLIDGYGTTSTRYAEEFNNEAERLVNNGGSAPTDAWDSSAALGSTDLFIQDGSLKRIPTVNYSSGYIPANTVNYTSNTSDQVYIREFRTNSVEKVNGLVEIGGSGITESAIIAEDVILEVSTDGTTWGKINDSTDYRIDKTIYSLNQSGGNKRIRFGLGDLGGVAAGTGLSSYGMFMRVTIPNGSSVEVDYLRITDWA